MLKNVKREFEERSSMLLTELTKATAENTQLVAKQQQDSVKILQLEYEK